MVKTGVSVVGILIATALAFRGGGTGKAEDPPRPDGMTPTTQKSPMKTETATFGAGCFWGVEATFRKTPGVTATAVGYCGGKTKNPTYKDVCNDDTGHAEVVQVEFDPTKVSYSQLLDIFFDNHNPTTLNRQGPDHGTQYRSAIFYHSDAQRQAAEEAKARHQKDFKDPIVTEITLAPPFYMAEDYHQQYLEKRGLSSCHAPTPR